jgi:type VI protein secretion system component VasF
MPTTLIQEAQRPPAPPTRDELRQQIQDAIRAAREAAEAEGAAREAVVVQPAPVPMPPFADQGPPESVLVLIIVLASLAAATIIFAPLFRALGRRVERRGDPEASAERIAPRLDRIEQAIEAMAVEVERISEGQRYVTKQMHEMRALPAPNALAQSSVAPRVGEAVGRGEPGA